MKAIDEARLILKKQKLWGGPTTHTGKVIKGFVFSDTL